MLKLLGAFCFCCWALVSQAQTTDFYALEHIPELRITFKDGDWEKKLHANRRINKKREQAQLTIDGQAFKDVGVRFKGNSSYHRVVKNEFIKLPWNIKLDEEQDEQFLPTGHSKIKLANVFGDPSFLREVLAYELAGKYMPASKANFARVYVNDQYLGLYTNTEAVDKHFLDYFFDENDGIFIKCDPESWKINTPAGCTKSDYSSLAYLGENPDCYKPYYELESKEGWPQLIQLTKNLQQNDNLEAFLHVDQFLWMHAFNNIIGNLDSYAGLLCHNYYIYQDQSGRFSPIIWDLNLAFGGFRIDGEHKGSLSNQQLIEISPLLHYNNPKRPLLQRLLQHPRYRKWYLAHFRTLFSNHFENGSLVARARELQTFIKSEVAQDSNNLYSYQLFEKNLESTVSPDEQDIIGLIEFIAGRTAYLKSHPLLSQTPPEIANPVADVQQGKVVFSCKISNAAAGALFYRTTPDGPFQEVALNDRGENGDPQAGDSVYSVTMDYRKGAEYYFLAENEQNARFLPEGAAFQFFRVD